MLESIAFIIDMGSQPDIEAVHPDDTGHIKLVESGGTMYRGTRPSHEFHWSPSGTCLVYELLSIKVSGVTGGIVCRVPFSGFLFLDSEPPEAPFRTCGVSLVARAVTCERHTPCE